MRARRRFREEGEEGAGAGAAPGPGCAAGGAAGARAASSAFAPPGRAPSGRGGSPAPSVIARSRTFGRGADRASGEKSAPSGRARARRGAGSRDGSGQHSELRVCDASREGRSGARGASRASRASRGATTCADGGERLAPVVRARDLRPARRVSNAASSRRFLRRAAPARCVAGKKRASPAPRGGSGRPFAGFERSTGRRGSSTLSAGSKHPGSRARRPGDSGDRGDSPFRILGPSRAAGQIFASNEWRDTHPRRRARARVRSGTVGTGVRESIARHRTLVRGASTTSARRAASHPARRPLRAIWKSPAESAGFLPPSGYASGLVRLFLTEGAGPLGTRASSDRDRPPPPAGVRTRSEDTRRGKEGKHVGASFAPPPPSPRRSLRLPPLVFAPPRVVAPLPIDFRVVGFEPAPPRASRVPPFAPPARSRARASRPPSLTPPSPPRVPFGPPRAQSWADEPEGEFPRVPHGFSAFNQGPPGPGMGGLGFAPPGPAAAGGLGSLFGAPPGAGIGPAGGFGSMEREPPNYSFGTSPTFGTTGPPGGAMMGGGGGSFGAGSGFANPAPGFGAPAPAGWRGVRAVPPGWDSAPRDAPPGMGTKASDGPGGGQSRARTRTRTRRRPVPPGGGTAATGRRCRFPTPRRSPRSSETFRTSALRTRWWVCSRRSSARLRTCAWSATGTPTARGGTSSSSRTARASRRRSPSTSATWAGGRSG